MSKRSEAGLNTEQQSAASQGASTPQGSLFETSSELSEQSSEPEPAFPWANPSGVSQVVKQWRKSGKIKPCVALERLIENRSPEYVSLNTLDPALDPRLSQALAERGIHELYSHQALAIQAARGPSTRRETPSEQLPRHVVIATPTASGKSLCFHLPVLEELAKDPHARAIYLYPTKALSRDQEHGVRALAKEAGLDIGAIVYDGDTPGDARKAARNQARVILTNPDMLHGGILPTHTRWASAFQGLRYVVIDELHTYRGVFGSHMAHVIARLKRIAEFHGANPQFICATATIGNPREHAARLLGVDGSQIELVDRSGAPQTSRQLYVYNPPIVNEELGVRGSALKHAVYLTDDLIRAKIPTIVFAPSRNSVEIILKYLRERAGNVAGEGAIMGYRSGYLPETRRNIEQGLREGRILCVVSTNALELGIDIGELSAVVSVGYPGSIAATWQRFGRAGRRNAETDAAQSIAVMVLQSGALDQYLGKNPEFLLDSQAEEARIDPNNVEILIQHMKCAAFELPFELTPAGERPLAPSEARGEAYGPLSVSETRDALDYLTENGLVHPVGERYRWSGEAFPASNISLRALSWDNFIIIDVASGKTIAELDWRATHTMLHEQAIYQHDAEQYQVEKLDYENHKAFVRKVVPDFFTTALVYRNIAVLDEHATTPRGRLATGWGEIKVVERVTGFKKIKYNTHENAGYGDVHLPELQMHTTSFWLTVPEALIAQIPASRAAIVDALRGFGRALETVCTIALMCEPSDIGQSLGDGEEELPVTQNQLEGGPSHRPPARIPGVHTGALDPTLFLFDAIPNGVGLAERIYQRAPELLERAHQLITSCPCPAGCPACIGPSELHFTPPTGNNTENAAPSAALVSAEERKAISLNLYPYFALPPVLRRSLQEPSIKASETPPEPGFSSPLIQ